MPRTLLGTDLFIAAAYNRQSPRREAVAAVERSDLKLVVNPAIVREYEEIIPKSRSF